MVVQDLLAFKKEKAAVKRASRQRFLGSSSHVAWFVTHHLCDRCATEISGGMAYVREVYLTGERITVRRYHSPICPDHYWRTEEMEREQAEACSDERKVA